MKRIFTLLLLAATTLTTMAQKTIYDFTVTDNKGNEVQLSQYKGKVLLIVNTATACGFTPQYNDLDSLYDSFRDKGLEILDFPCNQFGAQAPGTDEEIQEFCTLRYNTQFPRFRKIEVNGENEHPLYTWLKSQEKGKGTFGNAIKWNFTKFLLDREGNVTGRYGSVTPPEKLEPVIADLLEK